MDKKQKLLVLQGIPASGKTTWAREFLKGKTDWVRVNRDDLRRMRGDYWVKSQEDLSNTLERNTIIFSLNAGYNVIVDATNLNPKSIDKWKQIANDNSVDIEFKKFDVSLKEAIERDNNRNGDGVGESVIKRFYYKYIDSNKEEIRYIKQDKSLPKAIICDIDGTLALRNGRSPFEFDKIDQDKVNEPILNILKQYEEYHIYIVS